tara:strand:- start:47891 stop:48373 length:483 start_codon:yes stop_codon:yes gene_type:complete
MIEICAKPITKKNFERYGDILDSPKGVGRFDYAAKLMNKRHKASPNLLLAKIKPSLLPMTVKVMEKHEESSQSFFPLDVRKYLVLVCPDKANNEPDIQNMDAFIVTGNQGINYFSGVWHHPLTTIEKTGVFAALVWEDGTPRDTTWHNIPSNLQLSVILA